MPNRYVVLNQKDSKDIKLGEVRAVLMPPELEDIVVTPSTEAQDITPTKGKYFKDVKVEPVTADIDSNIQENNIRQGVTILGKTGNLAPDKPDQIKTTVPSKERQHIKADTGYELAENIVEPIPEEYEDVRDEVTEQNEYIEDITAVLDGQDIGVVDVTDTTATANDVATGKMFYNANGEYIEGSGKLEQTLQGIDDISVPEDISSIGNSYNYMGSLVTVKNDIFTFSRDSSNKRCVYYLDKANKQWVVIKDRLDYYSGDESRGIFVYPDGDVYIISFSSSNDIRFFDSTTKITEDLSVTDNSYPNTSFQDFLYDEKTDRLFVLSGKPYIFNRKDRSFVKLSVNGTSLSVNEADYYLSNSVITDYGIFASGRRYILKFNEETLSFDTLYDGVTVTTWGFSPIYYKNIGLFFTVRDTSGSPIHVYNPNTDSIQLAYDKYYVSTMFISSKNDLLVSTSSTKEEFLGVLRYNKESMLFERISNTGSNMTFYECNNGDIFCHYSNAIPMVIRPSGEIIKFEEMYGTLTIVEIESGTYLSCSSSSHLGVYRLTSNSSTLQKVLDTGYSSIYVKDIPNFGTFMQFNSSTYGGLYRLNEDTLLFEKVYSSGTGGFNYYYYESSNLLFILRNDVLTFDGTQWKQKSGSSGLSSGYELGVIEGKNYTIFWNKNISSTSNSIAWLNNESLYYNHSFSTPIRSPQFKEHNGKFYIVSRQYVTNVFEFDPETLHFTKLDFPYIDKEPNYGDYVIGSSSPSDFFSGCTIAYKNGVWKQLNGLFSSPNTTTYNYRGKGTNHGIIYLTGKED